jgi:hypothetical protein
MRPAQYILLLLEMTLLGLCAIGIFNALVDPLDLLDRAGIHGLDQRKPLVNVYARISKPLAGCRVNPSFLILGTSRSQHALDPEWPGLSALGYRGFNLAFPGASIHEIRRAFENAAACGSLRGALIELDFFAFGTHAHNAPDFQDDLLRRSRGDWLRPSVEILRLLTSLDMLKESFQTLRTKPSAIDFESDGRETDSVFERRVETWGGVRGAFRRAEFVQFVVPIASIPLSHRPNFRFPDGSANTDDLGAIIDLANRDHVRLWFYFAPVHARQNEILRALELWPQYEDWKATLVRFCYTRAQRLGFADPPQIWDFSGYNSVSTERVPVLGDTKSRMTGYWESSHIRKHVGDLILARIFGNSSQQSALQLPADFGVRLNPANVDSNTQRIRAEAIRYRYSHPSEEEEVEREVDDLSPVRSLQTTR